MTHPQALLIPTKGASEAPWSPLVLEPALWFDAAQLTGLVDNDPVGSWTDASGNGRHAVQGTGAAKPTYKTAALNGRPVVRFDGVDDWLQTAAFGAALAQPTTITLVGTATGADNYFYDGLNDGGRHVIITNNGGSSTTALLYAGTGAPYTVPAFGPARVYTALFSGAASRLWVDGTAAGAAADGGTLALPGLTLGAYWGALANLTGDVAEVVLVNRALSGDERAALEAYLKTKWGTP
jgi:hypothetical protein